MCAYLSKSEDESSQAMSEAMKDAFEKQSDIYEQMKLLLTLIQINENVVYKSAFITF